MASPFPGMDPFLEDPGLWPDVHHGLISEMQAELNRRLRPKYHVRVEERVYISDENDPGRKVIIPDLRVADTGRSGVAVPGSADTGTSVLEVAEPIMATTLIEEEIREAYLEVIDRSLRQVVTVIEVVSPTNKAAGSKGRVEYQRKRHEIMQSPSHLVEIDLLRAGESLPVQEPLPACDYTVHVSRTDQRPRGKIWPILLHQRLPNIDIPLGGDDPDAKLDLQAILQTVYERGAYDLEVDYAQQPVPPLNPEHAAWVDQVLKGRGLR